MKNFFRNISFVLLVLILHNPLWSQESSNNIEELLIGSRVFDYKNSMEHMDSSAKSHCQKMRTERKEKVRSNYEGRVITFNDNGGYSQKLVNGKEFLGRWETNGDRILITDAGAVLREYKIISVSASELVLKPKVEASLKPLMSEWHFIKSY
ncbi:hypothetical protein CJ739_1740 [Mariniflexile rhizosphaerae]|nr:hypothetical protein CJ739_1740 [Mariniflexile sp. TRM1-10]